jgi:N-acetyl sugar amidotransferase
MKKKKNLVLLVSNYPGFTGEPFLEEEVKKLENSFDKIIFFQTNKNNQSDELYMPLNGKTFSLDADHSNNILDKINALFTFYVCHELFLLFFKHRIKINLQIIKTIVYYYISSKKSAKIIEKEIKNKGIDINETVFYSYWCNEVTLSLYFLKRKYDMLDYVVRLHGWDLYFERHETKFLPFREKIYKKALYILPISKDGKKYILKNKLVKDKEKVIVSQLGVKDFNINPSYKEIKINSGLTILSISHIIELKRLDKIIDALSIIDDNIEIHWKHIGWGKPDFENKIKSLAEEKLKHKKNITFSFLGKLDKQSVEKIITNDNIDLVINSSDTEGIPVSLMEAISAGIPIIGYDIGGIPEIISDNVNGFLLKSNTKCPELELAQAITKFSNFTELERSEMSRNAKLLWQSKYNSCFNYSKMEKILTNIDVDHYVECSRCLVNSDIHKEIVLNKYGICDICEIIDTKIDEINLRRNSNYLANSVSKIKSIGKNQKYDCVIGISGGVDSAFLVLKAKELGLRPLLVHIDNGWNSELAVFNIESLVNQLGFDLYTVVIDWYEIQDIVKSFLRASVIDIDWANEMCFVSTLYKVAKKFGIKSILTGHQVASEGWMPEEIVHYKLDLINFKDIHDKFGEIKLKTYPTIGYLKSFYYEKILKIKYYYPLDYLDYHKDNAKKELVEKFGWRDYGQKHFENIFTRFYQAYILPKKFNVDKRIFHYSALIASNQLSKEEAKELLNDDNYFTSGQYLIDKEFIQKKLGFSEDEFDQILDMKPKSHLEYKSFINIIKKVKKIKDFIFGL